MPSGKVKDRYRLWGLIVMALATASWRAPRQAEIQSDSSASRADSYRFVPPPPPGPLDVAGGCRRSDRRDQKMSGRISHAAALRSRESEIVEAILTRMAGVEEVMPDASPDYPSGLHAAVEAGLDYSLRCLETDGDRFPPVPSAITAHARAAASHDVRIETVFRRASAASLLLTDFLIGAGERDPTLRQADIKFTVRRQANVLDALLAAIGLAYSEVIERGPLDGDRRRARQIERLLRGEPLETTHLDYPFDGWNLAMIMEGDRAPQAMTALAANAGSRLLMVKHTVTLSWGWLGGSAPPDAADVSRELDAHFDGLQVALGEVAEGWAGWRLSHRQARAAWLIAKRRGDMHTRYGEVALLASMLGDQLLTASLRELYLNPLSTARDGGYSAKATLRAYFLAERNTSSAAALLGISRQSVSRRLRAVEEQIGRPINSCSRALEAAVELDEIGTD